MNEVQKAFVEYCLDMPRVYPERRDILDAVVLSVNESSLPELQKGLLRVALGKVFFQEQLEYHPSHATDGT